MCKMKAAASFVICTQCFFRETFLFGIHFRRYLPVVLAVSISLCASSCTKYAQQGKGSSLLSPPVYQLSRLLPCFLSTEGSSSLMEVSIAFLFYFPLLGLSWLGKAGQQPLYSTACSYLAAQEQEAWETTKHIRPNYSPDVKAFLDLDIRSWLHG